MAVLRASPPRQPATLSPMRPCPGGCNAASTLWGSWAPPRCSVTRWGTSRGPWTGLLASGLGAGLGVCCGPPCPGSSSRHAGANAAQFSRQPASTAFDAASTPSSAGRRVKAFCRQGPWRMLARRSSGVALFSWPHEISCRTSCRNRLSPGERSGPGLLALSRRLDISTTTERRTRWNGGRDRMADTIGRRTREDGGSKIISFPWRAGDAGGPTASWRSGTQGSGAQGSKTLSGANRQPPG
jgi:hypothetical protein